MPLFSLLSEVAEQEGKERWVSSGVNNFFYEQ